MVLVRLEVGMESMQLTLGVEIIGNHGSIAVAGIDDLVELSTICHWERTGTSKGDDLMKDLDVDRALKDTDWIGIYQVDC